MISFYNRPVIRELLLESLMAKDVKSILKYASFLGLSKNKICRLCEIDASNLNKYLVTGRGISQKKIDILIQIVLETFY